MDGELHELFLADRREHAAVPEVGTVRYQALRERDARRRRRAEAILAATAAPAPEDLYHAAWVLNHGDAPAEARRAHELALEAARQGCAPARWLAAAAYDRWCMYRGLPQRYGTQLVPDGARHRLWDCEPGVGDEERAAWDVPPLAEQQRRADEMTRTEPQPPMEHAPEWLQRAIVRWATAAPANAAAPAGYYAERLAAGRLRRCYELAPPAVQRYLAAEIEHVRARLRPGDRALELGCGYGRVLRELAPACRDLVGVDSSPLSLAMARSYLAGARNVSLALMDAILPALRPASFDVVLCVQNGISAFHTDRRRLLRAAVELVRPGGAALFSSYATGFWEDRLAWFRLQAADGLVDELDEEATGAGEIVCRDGFTAATVSPGELATLAAGLGRITVEVVADSSVFCEIRP